MSNTEYLVVKKTKCSKCNGYGEIDSPEYKLFKEWKKYKGLDNMPYITSDDSFWLSFLTNNLSISVEEANKLTYQIPCPYCNGEGYITETVSLREALEMIGFRKDK